MLFQLLWLSFYEQKQLEYVSISAVKQLIPMYEFKKNVLIFYIYYKLHESKYKATCNFS